ncbi:hypothetical protein [Streptomyces sp. NPDC056628]|uniref:hypothetical protein n=1 Tax=Streptomyces sp. NPDC056628 TaxID=3345882 RepID=UPI0036D04E70
MAANHGHGIRYGNHPGSVTAADFKPAQLQTAAQPGLPLPPILITGDVEDAQKFAAEHGPVIYKPFRGLPPAKRGTPPRPGPSAPSATPSTSPWR